MLEDGRGPTKEEFVQEFAFTEEGHEVQVRSLELLGFGTTKPQSQELMGPLKRESF
jgi:hypothetical protein